MGESSKSKAELILEYVKVFIWPVLITIAVLVYHNLALDIIKNRKWKVGIVEVGERVETLEKAVQEQLIFQKDNLESIKEHANNPDKVKQIADMLLLSLKNTQVGVKQEARSIGANIERPVQQGSSQDGAKYNSEAKKSTPTTAVEWEKQGFSYLLSKNIDDALRAFTEAETIWPDFHNVSEIRSLLVKEKNFAKGGATTNWNRIYNSILKDYSWGMPSDARKKMQQLVEKGS